MEEIIPVNIESFPNLYSPSTLLGVFASALRSPVDGKLVLAKGIYQAQHHSKVYGEYFYDSIKSLHENKSVKARIPSIVRNKLENNEVYIFKGFIEKKISFSAIELTFVVDEVLQREEKISDSDLKRAQLIQKKTGKGFRDFEKLVKTNFYLSKTTSLVVVYGNNAIVNKDFEKGLGNAAVHFKITELRCNFSSAAEIRQCLNALKESEMDAVALIRGGGNSENLEIFNDPIIGEVCVEMQPAFITALGHTVNESLADKLADKKFDLPFDLGNKLKSWIDEAADEQSRSKSIFINQVRMDLEKTYAAQIRVLGEQLELKNKEMVATQLKFSELIDQNQKDKTAAISALEQNLQLQIKTLKEQVENKEQALKTANENLNSLIEAKIITAVADFRAQNQILLNEKSRLEREKARIKILLFIVIVVLILVGIVLQ